MRFLAGFLIGLLIGSSAVLLTTPQSGGNLKHGIQSRIDNILNEGRKAATDRRAELEARLTELKSGQA
jgi:gas vesicle protein